ncbi:MAG: hypothetical protein NTY53_11165 [Kiritimatiellaeota bacterium]|nr:hypothetical protein [Kiritimatiellota bacterium]
MGTRSVGRKHLTRVGDNGVARTAGVDCGRGAGLAVAFRFHIVSFPRQWSFLGWSYSSDLHINTQEKKAEVLLQYGVIFAA